MNSPSGLLIIFPLLLCQYSSVISVALFSATTEAAGASLKVKAPKQQRQHQQKRSNHSSLSSVFIFGDSTVDPGNNNYVATLSRSNFPPYGKDFLNHIPTGRFTNGKLVTDFFSGYLGIKESIPPYLDPTLTIEELTTGVSFASAGSGYDPLTAQLSSVIPIQQQLHYFKEYKTRMEEAVGKEKAKALIKNAFYFISCGTNDYVVNYFSTPLRQYAFSVSEYQQFLLKTLHQFLQGLIAEGAETVVVVGLPPMGCLPVVITLNSNDPFGNRKCVEKFSSAARNYNDELQKLLNAVRLRRPNLKLIYADIFTPVNDMIANPTKYGFTETNSGCCGSGLIEGGILCNPKSLTCSDDSKYVFWDSVHPTQATYHYLFKALVPLVDSIL